MLQAQISYNSIIPLPKRSWYKKQMNHSLSLDIVIFQLDHLVWH